MARKPLRMQTKKPAKVGKNDGPGARAPGGTTGGLRGIGGGKVTDRGVKK